jgi:hypothetical protein
MDHLGWEINTVWKYHFEFAVWPMMAGFFCEYRRGWFSNLSVKLMNVILWSSLAVCGICFGLMLAGHEMKLAVVGAGNDTVSPLPAGVPLWTTGVRGAGACVALAGRADLFDLSVATAIDDLQLSAELAAPGRRVGRNCHWRGELPGV